MGVIIFKKILFFTLFFSTFLTAEEGEYVVCIHGFLGAPWNMHFLARNLRKDGWDVDNWKYRSRNYYIEEHGRHLVEHLIDLAEKKPKRPIHFTTHSMGGLVLLSALNHPLCPEEAKMGKVVLIAPPLRGSNWARWLGQFSIVKWVAKRFSGWELMTEPTFNKLGSYPDSLEDVLLIAGNLGWNPFFNEENDGTIALRETFLATPHKQVVVKCGHKTIIFSKKVCRLVRQFYQKEK